MKNVVLIILITLLISLSGLTVASTGSIDSNSRNLTNSQMPVLPPVLEPNIEIDINEPDIIISDDYEWIGYSKDFKKKDQNFLLLFNSPTIIVEDGFTRVSVPDCSYSQLGTKPTLPQRTIVLTYPPGTRVINTDLIPSRIIDIEIDNPIIPIIEPIPIMPGYEIFDQNIDTTPKMDEEVYSNDQLYPNQWYEISLGMGLNPFNDERNLFVVFHIYPVQYNPVQNKIYYITAGELEIKIQEPDPEDDDNDKDNNNEPTPNTRSDGDGSRIKKHDMVIICPDIFKSELTDFAKHKTNTGVDTIIVTMGDIVGGVHYPVQGRDEAEKIKYFIYNAAKNWDIKYVLLVGDVERIPTRITFVHDGINDKEASDLYFADVFDSLNNFCSWDFNNDDVFAEYTNSGNIDNADLYPDVHIGRFPASSLAEVSRLVDKTKTYEITAIGQSWYYDTVLCGLDTFAGGTPEGEYLSDQIASNYLQDFNNEKLYESTGTLSKANIKSSWSEGAGFVSFSDHGLHSSWGQVFSSSDVNTLTNGNKLPFVNYDACLCGEFDQGGSDCIAEITILKHNGGGVAVVASSRIAYGSFGRSHVNSASGFLNLRLYHNMHHNSKIAGSLLSAAKTDYLNNLGTGSSTHFKTVIEYNYFGDPSLLLGGLPTAIFNLDCKDNKSSVKPGGSTDYVIEVKNTDVQTRQIQLSTSTPPEKWNAELSKKSLSLLPNSSFNITLTVTAPSNALADFKADITVIAALANIERTICVGTKTTVNRIYGFDISSNGKKNITDSVNPGKFTNFTFQVFNKGNADERISFKLMAGEEAGYYWDYEFSEQSITVPPFSEYDLTIGFDIPEKTVASVYSFKVQGKMVSTSKTKNFEIFVNVLRIYSLALNCSNSNQSTDPGINLTFNLDMDNLGNHQETFEISIGNLPSDWNVKYKEGNEQINSTIQLEPFSSKYLKCIIQVAPGTLMGKYNLTVKAKIIEIMDDLIIESIIGLNIEVNRVYGVALANKDEEYFVDLEEQLDISIELSNLGNWRDYAHLGITGKPDDWSVVLHNYQNILLYANNKRDIDLTIIPGSNTKAGQYNVYLQATISGDNSIANLPIPVTVNRISDLYMSNSNIDIKFKAGETGKLNLYISNRGNDVDTATIILPEKLEFGEINLKDSNEVSLRAFESDELELDIELNKRVRGGTHSIPITAKLESSGENYTFKINFNVKEEHGIILDAVETRIITNPGNEIRVDVIIENTGNCKDNYTFEVTGIPETWEKKFPPQQSISIQPFSTLNKTLYFNIPSDEPYHKVKIQVKVQSKADPRANYIMPVNIEIEEEGQLFLGLTMEFLSLFIIIIILILVGFWGVYKFRTSKKQEEGMGYGKDNVIEYDRSSDGSKVQWEESSEPLPVQYNPPTSKIYGQELDLQVQAPDTYRKKTYFSSPIYHDSNTAPQFNIQAPPQPQLPPSQNMPIPQQLDGYTYLPGSEDGLNFKKPIENSSSSSFNTPEVDMQSDLLQKKEIQQTSPTPAPVEAKPVYSHPSESQNSIQSNQKFEVSSKERRFDSEFHKEKSLSLKFSLPQSKSQPVISGKVLEKKNEKEIESRIVEDDVKIFSLDDGITWKKPKRNK